MNNNKELLTIISEKKAIIFDLFHTLTVLEQKKVKGQGTSEMLGVDREQWNEQLIKYFRDRLTGKLSDPIAIIKKMVSD